MRRVCYLCAEVQETRPFGEHGQDVCFRCMSEPETRQMAAANLGALVDATSFISPSGIVTIDGDEIRPTRPDDLVD